MPKGEKNHIDTEEKTNVKHIFIPDKANDNKQKERNKEMTLLLNTLENENNIDILRENKQSIKCKTNDILQKLPFSRKDLLAFHEKLKDYRYIDDIEGVKHGCYIRWFSIPRDSNIPIKLSNGGIVCKIVYDRENSHNSLITVRGNMKRFYSLIALRSQRLNCVYNLQVLQKYS